MRQLSLNILDLAVNSIEAGATRIIIAVDERENILSIRVRDNGRGMSEEMARTVLDPFVTTRKTRKVGLGLPLLAQIARQCDGRIDIDSEPGRGTQIKAEFRHDHLNRPPLGRVSDTVINLIVANPGVHLYYHHRTASGQLGFDSYWMLARMAERDCSLFELVEPGRAELRRGLAQIHASAD